MKSKFLKHPEKFEVEQWGPIDFNMLYPSFWFGTMSGAIKSPYGIYWGEGLIINQGEKGTLYWPKHRMQQQGTQSIQKWLLPKDSIKNLEKIYKEITTELEALAQQIEKIGGTTDWQDIRKLALKWHAQYDKFWGWSNVFEFANFAVPAYLRQPLTSLVPAEDIDSVMEKLLTPENLSFNQESQKQLLAIRLIAKSGVELKKLLELHAKKWFWLDNSYHGSIRLDANYFYKKIQHLSKEKIRKELNEITNYSKKVKLEKKEVLKKFKLPKSIGYMSAMFSRSIWLQDHRKGIAWRASDTITLLGRALAKKLNIPFKEIINYTSEEFRQAFKTGKKIPKKILQKRHKLNAIYVNLGFYKFIKRPKVKELATRFSNLHELTDSNILQGLMVSTTASVIRGKVRVLHSPQNQSLMQKGEILVTAMTSPDYINAMRKAKAIITDVGGLMSHAAVVSRELGIPCIVNTKLATKVLKDGDMVEVDANKGIVRKL